MTPARFALLAILLVLANCGGGDAPADEPVCNVDGKPMPREACR